MDSRISYFLVIHHLLPTEDVFPNPRKIRIFHYLFYLGHVRKCQVIHSTCSNDVPVVCDVTLAFVHFMVHILHQSLDHPPFLWLFASLHLPVREQILQKKLLGLGCWRLKLQENGGFETADFVKHAQKAVEHVIFRDLELIQPRMASAENGDLEKILQEIRKFGNILFGVSFQLCFKYTLRTCSILKLIGLGRVG